MTETCLGDGDDVNLSLLCPPGFRIRYKPWGLALGDGVAVVFWNNITHTEKNAHQPLGLARLHLVLGIHDRVGLLSPNTILAGAG